MQNNVLEIGTNSINQIHTEQTVEAQVEKNVKNISPSQLRKQRFLALIKIRGLLIWRIKAKFFCQIMFPVIFIVVGAAVSKFKPNVTPGGLTTLTFNPSLYLNTSSSPSSPSLVYQLSAIGK